MKKVMALVLTLTLVVTALGVLTVAEEQEEVVKITYSDGSTEIKKVSVLPEAFAEDGALEGEGSFDTVVDNEEVTVEVDPIHVTE